MRLFKQDLISKFKIIYDGRYGFIIDTGMFIAITYGFHLLFRFFASSIMSIPAISNFSNCMADVVYDITIWINRNILQMVISEEPFNIMRFSNGGYVQVNTSCSGLKQFYQVFVLFALIPGPWRHKLWFIPLGILVMFFTNIFRVIALSIIVLWLPKYWDFSHDWVLRPFFYLILFAMWVLWVEKFARAKIKTSVE